MIRRSMSVLLAALLLTGCSAETKEAAPAGVPGALTGATSGLAAGNYRYSVVMPEIRIEGVVDAPHRALSATSTFSGDGAQVIEERLIGDDKYTRISAPGAEPDDRWEHLDLTELPAGRQRYGQNFKAPDRTGATQLLGRVMSTTTTGSTIRGTLNTNWTVGRVDALAGVGSRFDGPRTFAATLDDRGRLSRLEVDLPAFPEQGLPAGQWRLDVTDYGAVSGPERPTATTAG